MLRRAVPLVLVLTALTSVAQADRRTVFRRKRSRVEAAQIVAGVGAVSLATSWTLGIVGKVRYDNAIEGCQRTNGVTSCTDQDAVDRANNARDLARLGTWFFVGAAALEAAALVIYFTAPTEEHVVVAPVATENGGGLTFGGRF